MQTIILSAGKSSRVKEEGFPYQKCMLPMPDGKTMLEWQVKWLRPEKLLYISREEYHSTEAGLIKKLRMTIPNFTSVWIQHRTRGPLDGLWQARNFILKDEELLIVYNDELIAPEVLDEMIERSRRYNYPAAIAAFLTQNTRFTDVPGSDLSAGCTYYFANGGEFLKRLRRAEKGEKNGVPDIVYSFRNRLYFQVPTDKIIEVGTAREYRLWMAQMGSPVEEW